MNIRVKAIVTTILICAGLLRAGAATRAAEPPKDLLRMKPFVSTSKMGFKTNKDVLAAMNASAKIQALKNVGYTPVEGWMFDPKASLKSTKPDADTSGLTAVKLPNEWGKETSAIFRTQFTMPEKINNYSFGDSPVSLAFEGSSTMDVYVNGKRVGGYSGSGELDITGKIKPGETVTLGVKVTEMTGRGRLGSVRVHAAALDGLKAPAEEVLTLLESAQKLFDQLPSKQKDLVEAVSAVSKEAEALKGASDPAVAKAALEKMKTLLAPMDKLIALYPIFNAGPSLQNVKQDEITIAWETRVPASSEVYYGKDGLTNVVYDPTPVQFHKVVIKGLETETEYKYLAVTNKLAAPESTFKTSIKRDTPFKFVVFSDDQSNPQIFEPLVDLMIPLKPNILLSTGDEVGNGSDYSAWAREFFYPLRRIIINTPFFVAIGNHEYSGFGCGNPVPWFEKYMALPEDHGHGYYYAMTYGNSRFIMMNQQMEVGCAGLAPGAEQFEWLKRELESPEYKAATFHFMLFHKPPYSQCWSGGYYDGEASLRANLVPLIEKYKVDIIFSGHTHDYERGQWPRPDGPYYIITGGAGGGLDDTKYKDWPQMEMYKFVHHFSFVTIEGNKLKFQAIADDGKPIDSFEITK